MADAPREMAAVMFTDVRGYSALAQRDEALALRLLVIKRTLADPLITGHHGRLVKTIGDALMVEFKSALAAVQCATDLQKKLHEHNQSVPDAERLVVRIGVHLGDVVRKDGDLLGDTVNIAARVEPQAPPGGIALTQTVYEQIRGKFDYPLLPLGGQKLKGIENDVALYAVKLPWQSDFPTASPRPGLIARLKQHHIFRVASWYATAAYVLILVANAVFPDIGLTRDDVRYVIAGLALGFPVVITLSWVIIPPSRQNVESFSNWKRLRWRLGAVFSLIVIAFVTISGIYLWRLNAQHLGDYQESAQAQSIVVLPFDKQGTVDDTMVHDMQQIIETTLSNLGSVRLVSHSAVPTAQGQKPPLQDIAKTTGTTLVLQGSIESGHAKSSYTIHIELIAVNGSEQLYSNTQDYAVNAPVADIEQQTASEIAGPVRFLTRGDAWLSKGFPTTKNLHAMQLLRRALMAFYYQGEGAPRELLREALDLDPGFAQAHAYLSMFDHIMNPIDSGDKVVESEISEAEKQIPGLPEAQMARGFREFQTGHFDAARRTLGSLEQPLANNYFFHFLYGSVLRELGSWNDSLGEFTRAAELDPYQQRAIIFVARLTNANRDYGSADSYLTSALRRTPLWWSGYMYQAYVEFDADGNVGRLANAMGRDWSRFGLDPDDPQILARHIEISHLQGKHAEVLRELKEYTVDCLPTTSFGYITGRLLCLDSFSAESLRLLGRDKEAAQIAKLREPLLSEALAAGNFDQKTEFMVHLALLEAFGDESPAALRTIAPLITRLVRTPDRWTADDALYSSDVAAVLAWSGQQQQAIELLKKSLVATYGAHAAVIANDPVWRPLYKEPAFVALLAAQGQKLAYAH